MVCVEFLERPAGERRGRFDSGGIRGGGRDSRRDARSVRYGGQTGVRAFRAGGRSVAAIFAGAGRAVAGGVGRGGGSLRFTLNSCRDWHRHKAFRQRVKRIRARFVL
jgi:hypothetical protein